MTLSKGSSFPLTGLDEPARLKKLINLRLKTNLIWTSKNHFLTFLSALFYLLLWYISFYLPPEQPVLHMK